MRPNVVFKRKLLRVFGVRGHLMVYAARPSCGERGAAISDLMMYVVRPSYGGRASGHLTRMARWMRWLHAINFLPKFLRVAGHIVFIFLYMILLIVNVKK